MASPKASSPQQLLGRPPDADDSERPILTADVSPVALGPLVPPSGDDATVDSPGVSPHPATVAHLASASPTAEGNITPFW